MTRVKDFFEIGDDTGNPLTSTVCPNTYSRTFIASAAKKVDTGVVPVSSQLFSGTVTIPEAVTGSVASMTLRVGVSASAAQFGTVRISAAGTYNLTLTRFASSLDAVSNGQIVVDVTAATSGAALGGNVYTRLLFGRL